MDCPACAEPIEPKDAFCEACGQDLHGAVVTAALKAPDPAKCVECSGSVSDNYCNDCGVRQPTGRDHVEIETPGACGVSDKGKRHSKNEDAMAITRSTTAVVGVVCDGVSSSPRPEDASQTAADTAAAIIAREIESGTDPLDATRTAAAQALKAVSALAESPHNAPACTYVSAIAMADKVTLGWMGDSRAYWMGPGAKLLSRDDSWAEQMVALGVMDEAAAMASKKAHMLIGWLGADAPEADAHLATFEPEGPGVVLVCSDGLWNYLPDVGQLMEAAPDAASSPMETARKLAQIALDEGGRDNITVVLIPFPPEDPTGDNELHE